MRTGIVVVTVMLAFSGCSFFDSNLTKACEEALKERLRSPSSYVRVSIDERSSAVEYDKYVAQRTDAFRRQYSTRADREAAIGRVKTNMEAMKARGESPILFTQIIEYDASNAYGAMIRGRAECTYLSGNAKQHDGLGTVRIDGKTHIEWLQSRI